MKKVAIVITTNAIAIALFSIGFFISMLIPSTAPTYAQQKEGEPSHFLNQTTIVRIQNTSMSIPAPNALANNQTIPHQIVIPLPLREDGKIWTGTATFTASKPIEIEVLHKYNPAVMPDAQHGEPYNGKWIDGSNIAISTMTMFSNTPVSVTNTPISTGSFVFTGSALVFHKTSGDPFTVTYTIDAVANNMTKIK